MQDKKAAELERQKELAELFAVAIKQPKIPAGVRRYPFAHLSLQFKLAICLAVCCHTGLTLLLACRH